MRTALPFSIGAHVLLLAGIVLWTAPQKSQPPVMSKPLRVELSLLSPRPPAAASVPAVVPRTQTVPTVPSVQPKPRPRPVPQAVRPNVPEPAPVREAPPPVPAVTAPHAPEPAVSTASPEAAPPGPVSAAAGGTGPAGGTGGEAGVVKVSAAMLANKGNAAYVGTLFSWLEKYRQYPRRARLTNTEGTVMLRFRIDRDGNLLAWNIVRSSGSPLLDKAVEDMITAANPLPKIPVEFGGSADARSWEFVLPIDFRLLT